MMLATSRVKAATSFLTIIFSTTVEGFGVQAATAKVVPATGSRPPLSYPANSTCRLLVEDNQKSDCWGQKEEQLTVKPFSSPCHGRRGMLQGTMAVVVAAALTTAKTFGTEPALAADPTTIGESIRSAAPKGFPSYYGPTDVFYPSSWKGLWNARRVRVDDDTVAAVYQVRFITSIQDDAVILDRGFSQTNLERAKRQEQQGRATTTGTSTGDSCCTTQWTETNPNVLRIDYDDGSWRELKVTQRATERTVSSVSSSEVYRITTQPPPQSSGSSRSSSGPPQFGGVPTITARRVVTKWQAVDDRTIQGLELIYDTASTTSPAASAPTLLAKTRIILER
jgi:hypothetical protein